MDYLYVITSACLLTWFRWNQHIQGRSYPFVGISCLYGVWMLASGTTIPLDGVTVATLALVIWLIGSIMWSKKALCAFELLIWLSYLLLFTAARTIPLELMLWILVPNAAIFAALQLYRHTKFNINEEWALYPVFGNSNHNAAFMLVGFYAALWLSANVTYWMFLFVFIIGLAIIKTMRRGPLLALVASLVLATALMKSEIMLYLVIIAFVAAIPSRARLLLMAQGYFMSDRMNIYKDAIRKLHPCYVFGKGLNYFRDTKYGRVHNDALELIGEIGIIGLLFFINIFLQMNLDPIMICAVVAFWVDAMFFYPFREQHTAVPFWAMIGAAAGFSVPASMLPMQIAGIGIVVALLLFTFTVFSNLLKWDKERRDENKGMDSQKLRQSARA